MSEREAYRSGSTPMTSADMDALNWRIFEKLGWWKPRQICRGSFRALEWHEFDSGGSGGTFPTGELVECRHGLIGGRHEIPPPNIMDWDTFGRVLMETKPYEIGYDEETDKWACELRPMDDRIFADTPQLALTLAVDAMEQK